jgi:hypothetical protein
MKLNSVLGIIVASIFSIAHFSAAGGESEQDPSVTTARSCVGWVTNGSLRITYARTDEGAALPLGRVVLDSDNKTAGPARGGMRYTHKDSPVDTVGGFGRVSAGNSWGDYSNIRIDVRELKNKMPNLELFEQQTTDGDYCCRIGLLVGNHESLTISKSLIVYPDDRKTVQDGGPYVSTCFTNTATNSDGIVVLQNSIIHLLRNGTEFAKSGFGQRPVEIGKARTENDVLEWYLTDAKGTRLTGGKLGFPVIGASQETVAYIVDVSYVQDDLHNAAMHGDLEKVKALLKGIPNLLSIKDRDGITPLHVASSNGRKDVVEFLLSKGADKNAINVDGMTPLHLAAGYGHKEVVELLLSNNADVNIKDSHGMTPMRVAKATDHNDIVEFLRQHGGTE